MSKIGIIGSRVRDTIHDYYLVAAKFREVFQLGDSIVSGGCLRGGDNFAEVIASELKIPIKIYPANWRKYGKGAGFVRNKFIAEDSDILIACSSGKINSGTEDTIRKYLKLGKIKLFRV